MSSVTLTREPVAVADLQHDDTLYSFDDLAKQAKECLGYGVMAETLPAAKKLSDDLRALQSAMRDLDIQPFREADVEAYKKAEVRRATSHVLKIADIGEKVGVVSILSSAASLVIVICMALAFCMFAEAVPVLLGHVAFAFLITFAFGVVVTGCSCSIIERTRRASWWLTPIEGYSRPIPEFALQTAIDLKRACPAATFHIDELRIETRTLDPFLVVAAGGEQYAIEVWNEARFSQRREI